MIQVPILIAIIGGILVLGGGYLGIKQYERQTEIQQKALEQALSEIENLKQQDADSAKKQTILEQKIQKNQQGQNLSISASELAPYLTGVANVTCQGADHSTIGMGSGSFMRVLDTLIVLSNNHVFQSSDYRRIIDYCLAVNIGIYDLSKPIQLKNTNGVFVDVAIAKASLIGGPVAATKLSSPPNDSIGSLTHCDRKMPIGSPVAIVGFPAYGISSNRWHGTTSNQITTEGIISGYYDAGFGLVDENYFVTAKVDAGNSGGAAFSKTAKGLCFLGIPTWVSQGEYENTGVVQSINNIDLQGVRL